MAAIGLAKYNGSSARLGTGKHVGKKGGLAVDILAIVLLLLVIGAAIVWVIYNSRPGAFAFDTEVPPQEVIEQAVVVYAMAGWSTTSRSGNQVTFVRESRPSCCLAAALAVVFILPALLYMVLWRETDTASVTVFPDEVVVTWNRRSSGHLVARDVVDAVARLESSRSRKDSGRTLPAREACPKCGAMVPESNKYCGECGERVG